MQKKVFHRGLRHQNLSQKLPILMNVSFAVKSGTKLLSYAAAVRRQLFGKWLHLNMYALGRQSLQGHQARDEGWKQLPSSHVVCSTSCHTKQNDWARRTLIAESPSLFLKVRNQCQRRWGRNFNLIAMLKVTDSNIGFQNSNESLGFQLSDENWLTPDWS